MSALRPKPVIYLISSERLVLLPDEKIAQLFSAQCPDIFFIFHIEIKSARLADAFLFIYPFI
jgi:hypothetical protein